MQNDLFTFLMKGRKIEVKKGKEKAKDENQNNKNHITTIFNPNEFTNHYMLNKITKSYRRNIFHYK